MPRDHDSASLQQAVGVVCGLTGVSPEAAVEAVRRDAAARGQTPEELAETLLLRWSAALRGGDVGPRLRALGPLLDDAMGPALSELRGDPGARHQRGSADDLADLADPTDRLRDDPSPAGPHGGPAAAPTAGHRAGGTGLSATQSADLAEALGLPADAVEDETTRATHEPGGDDAAARDQPPATGPPPGPSTSTERDDGV